MDTRQLKLPIEWVNCRYYHECDAPLCPEDIAVKQCLWFPGETVCRLKNVPEWVQKQKMIAKMDNIDNSKYFTVKMLTAIDLESDDVEGVDPELLGGEKLWLSKRTLKKKSELPLDIESAHQGDLPIESDARNYPLF